MRSWMFVVLVACGGPSKSAPPPTPTPKPVPVAIAKPAGAPNCPTPVQFPCVLTAMEYYSDAMCKCSDKGCADHVQDDLVKWAGDLESRMSKDDKPDPALAQKAGDVMQRYAECMTKILVANAGGTDPSLDDPPPPEEDDNPCGE